MQEYRRAWPSRIQSWNPSRNALSSHFVARRRALSTYSLHPVAYCELAQEAALLKINKPVE
jgi:hypothetical protein